MSAAKHLATGAMRLGGHAAGFLRQQLKRRGAELREIHPGFAAPLVDEALQLLRSDSTTAFTFLAVHLKAVLTDRADLFLEQPVREWLRGTEAEHLLRTAATTYLTGGDLEELRSAAGDSYARSSGDASWWGEVAFNLAVAFLAATLESQLTAGQRVQLQLLSDELAGMRAEGRANHRELMDAVGILFGAPDPEPRSTRESADGRTRADLVVQDLVGAAREGRDPAEVGSRIRALRDVIVEGAVAVRDVPLAVFAEPLSRFEEETIGELLAMDLGAILRTIHTKAEAYRALRNEVDLLAAHRGIGDDGVAGAISARLSRSLADGELERAASELGLLRDRLRELGARRSVEHELMVALEATAFEQQGRLEALNGSHALAAKCFMDASCLIPPGRDKERVRLLSLSVDELVTTVQRSSDEHWILMLRARTGDLWAAVSGLSAGEVKATALTSVSRALWLRGRTANAEDLTDAIAAAREAVAMTARESPKLAARLGRLADALMRRWEAQGTAEDHEESNSALQEGLSVAVDPEDRATILNIQASFAIEEGRRARQSGALAHAIPAYERALVLLGEVVEIWTRSRSQSDWAMANLNMSVVLSCLGEMKRSVPLLIEAKSLAEDVLTIYTEQSDALEWARQTNILGLLCKRIFVLANDPAIADEGMRLFDDCQRVRNYADRQIEWAATEENKGWLLEVVYDKTGDRATLERSIDHVADALRSFTRLNLREHSAKAKAKLDQLERKRAMAGPSFHVGGDAVTRQ